MRRMFWVLLSTAVLLGMSGASSAEQVTFSGGRLDIGWDESTVLHLRIELDEASAVEGTHTWVLTDLAHRFDDGVFAWQLHVSEEHQSLLVVPNDFLMITSFTFEQLGVELVAHETGRTLELRIPCSNPIPSLVVPGDRLEVHALWRQMAPIAIVNVPSDGEAGIAVGGGGGLGTVELPSADPLPWRDSYTIGETIRNRFVVIDSETGSPDLWASASCSLIQIENGASNFRRYLLIPREPQTGIFELEIETGDLPPGTYDLYVWTSADGGTSTKRRIILQEP